MNRIVVKVGSNVLTRSDGTLDVTRMSSIVDQIATLHKQGVQIILVSSGAVASGRSEMLEYRSALGSSSSLLRLDTVAARQLYSAVGQAKLMGKYYSLFRDYGIYCGQVLTTKESFSTRTHYLNQKHCMETMLAEGVIPIVNENDTISVTELMFTDNDELSGLVATMMDASKLVILSNIDGVYTGNPSDSNASLIPIITEDIDFTNYVKDGKSSFGRGGMATKYRVARKVANEGIEVVIANGKRDDILLSLLSIFEGSVKESKSCPCTRFIPADHRTSSVKKWIAHSESFSKGSLVLNEGAVQALCGEQAASILPIGIVEILGSFEVGDIVSILDVGRNPIGVGKINYDNQTALKMIGTKGGKPLVHYDYLWLES